MSTDAQGTRALLVIAHPGHELRIHGWLAQARPDVAVLTDGSGRTGRSRSAATRCVLDRAGAPCTALFSPFSDQQIYSALLDRDLDLFHGLCGRLLALLGDGGYRLVVADAMEGYNPTHDLCRLLVNRCVTALAEKGQHIRNLEFRLTGPPRACGGEHAAGAIWLDLDDQALARKLAAAQAYRELSGEVAGALATEGADAFRHECLRPADAAAQEPPTLPPSYESYGERQQAAGLYSSVIRYRQHFAPIADALKGSVLACLLAVCQS